MTDAADSGVQREPGGGIGLAEGERWYLVITGPREEQRARQNLVQQNFRPFLPQVTKTVRHARQLRTVTAPLFPRYMFVPLNLERDRWLSIRSTYGVSTLFMAGGRPAAVPQGVVESLAACADERQVTRLDLDLREGDAVKFVSGPFADLPGTLERLDDNGRVRVLLDIMGKATRVTVERSSLMPG
jgi:transcriptional antiterminator RfaH